MPIVTIGTANPIELDTAKLPEASVVALIRRGASHIFGNEVASKIVSWRNKHKADYVKANGGDEAGYAEPTEDEESAQRQVFVKAMHDALLDGSIGTRTRTAAEPIDPLEAEMHKVAKEQVRAILAKQQGPDGKALKFPKAGESVTFSNGATRTGEEMVARRLDLDGDNIKKLAQAALKAKAQRAKAVAQVSEGEDLGL